MVKMTLLRNCFKAVNDILCTKRCVMVSKSSWNVENYFGSKVEIPCPPKRPLSAYMIFCKENRKDLLKENPSLSSPEQIKILAEKWSHLTEDMKKPYEVSARQGTQVYGEEHKKFYESLTEEQKEEITRLKAQRLESRRILKLRKELRASGLPKGAYSAYMHFIQAEAKNKRNIKHPTDFMKQVAELWNSLPEYSKKVYEIQADGDKLRYTEEMKAWRARMLSEGKEKLLQAYDDMKRRGKVADSEEKKISKK